MITVSVVNGVMLLEIHQCPFKLKAPKGERRRLA